MKLNQTDIAIYHDAIDSKFCDRLIREFHKGFSLKEVKDGVVTGDDLNDYRADDFLVAKDINMYEHERWDKFNSKLHSDYVLPVLRKYLKGYKYILDDTSAVDPTSCIMSLYEANRGHFCPHQDSVAGLSPQRSLTVICYLNDVDKGGSTYFFNQELRVSPSRGMICVFPSNFVYGHIGETPVSNDKYITVSFASVDVGDDKKAEAYKEI